MNTKSNTWVIMTIGLILILGQANKAIAQSFEEARNLAFNGERGKARQMCRQLLAIGFDSDVALLLGRTYAWDGKYDSARVVLNEVLARNSENMEALDASADIEYWSQNYPKAIEYCNQALTKNPVEENFLYKKAKILHSSGRHGEAVSTLEKLILINSTHSEAMKKLQEYRLDLLKNAIQLTYTFDYFNKDYNRDAWHIGSVSYRRKTQFGSLIARVNLAQKFGSTGFQYEMDAYPKISENNYSYVNYGFSESSVFPKNRLGLEWYHNFPKAFEGSIGLRLMSFSNSIVDIYTATLGKYVGNYWLSLRSFVTPGENGTSVSGFLSSRRYFSDPENYVGMRLGYGISPDDSRRIIESDRELSLKAWSVRVEFNRMFNNLWIVNTGAIWGNEELTPGSFSCDYVFDISISRLF